MALISGKYCATCQYWDGARKIKTFVNKVEINSFSDLGVCQNAKCVQSRGKSRKAGQPGTCNRYEQWDQLK